MRRASALRTATRSAPLALFLISFLALAAAGCGSDDPPEPEPRPVETAEEPVELPDGWKRYVNENGGFELGLPRGWKASDRGTISRIRSFDELVVISIAPDRTNEALEYDLGEFAAGALASLRGYEGELKPSKPRRLKHHYDAVEVRAQAHSAASGVNQDISVIVLRRPKLALFAVVVQANASREAEPAREVADQVIKTIRSRPLR